MREGDKAGSTSAERRNMHWRFDGSLTEPVGHILKKAKKSSATKLTEQKGDKRTGNSE